MKISLCIKNYSLKYSTKEFPFKNISVEFSHKTSSTYKATTTWEFFFFLLSTLYIYHVILYKSVYITHYVLMYYIIYRYIETVAYRSRMSEYTIYYLYSFYKKYRLKCMTCQMVVDTCLRSENFSSGIYKIHIFCNYYRYISIAYVMYL